MPLLIQSREADFPLFLKRQVLALSYLEWPQAFSAPPGDEEPLNYPDLDPFCIALLEDELLLSYTGVQSIKLGECRVSGISGMLTHPDHRGQGAGRRVLAAATRLMVDTGSDIGLFTCDPPLAPFYAAAGWEIRDDTPLVGGTREKPFSSAQFDKVTLVQAFTERGREELARRLAAPIELALGEGRLW